MLFWYCIVKLSWDFRIGLAGLPVESISDDKVLMTFERPRALLGQKNCLLRSLKAPDNTG